MCVCVSVCLRRRPSACLSARLFACLSLCLAVCLSVCLSVSLFCELVNVQKHVVDLGLFLAAGVRLVLPVLLLLVVALCAFTFFVFLSGTRRCDDAVKLHARTISHSWGVQSVPAVLVSPG